jgi:hypothetical protein
METKFRLGNYLYKVNIEQVAENKLEIRFPYHPTLVEEVKCMRGARWNPNGRYWTIENCPRNLFQINYLEGKDVYGIYDSELIEWEPPDDNRKLYPHQIEAVRFILTRLYCILAYDTGIGKTLCAIEALEEMERRGWINNKDSNYLNKDIVWVGPKSALIAVQAEFWKWKSNLHKKIGFYTYDSLKKFCAELEKGKVKCPRVVIFDEAQKMKNSTSQRAQAGQYLADRVKYEFGSGGSVVLMTGTPAPHSPLDWYSLTEIACPGFLREGDLRKFQSRLGCVKYEENNVTGGMYPKLVTWFDNPDKCKVCGKLKEDFAHDKQSEGLFGPIGNNSYHKFEPSKNEIELLYKRLKGLTLIKFKRDVLENLPEINYRVIECQVSESTRRMAKLIMKSCSTTIEALTLLRELSDGFQYKDTISDRDVKCELCKGGKTVNIPVPLTECPACEGKGIQKERIREVVEIGSPKDKILIDLLDEYENAAANGAGRIVIYAPFTGCIDKIVRLVKKEDWNYIRVDGRGWQSDLVGYKNASQDMYRIFQEELEMFPKVCFIAHPGSGGIGLTLTAAPVGIYFSNDYNYEYRSQSRDRLHRIGSDFNRGVTIIDLVHLETDRKIAENLDKKANLQSMTLGDLKSIINKPNLGERLI